MAHDGDKFVGGVRIIGVGQNALLGVVADGVFVAAEDIDGVAADAQAGPRNAAFIDGIADGGIGGARTFGAHIAFRGKAGHQVVAGGQSRGDGALRH